MMQIPRFRWALGAALILSLLCLVKQPTFAQADVLTVHNDNARTGVNDQETILTPADVNAQQFGKLFSLSTDGYVYAQPLYESGVVIPGKGTHNVVFIATENNSVYAYDADSAAGPNSTALWRVNLGPPVPQSDVISGDLVPVVGITGTPVIDPTTQTLYVVAKTKENGQWIQRLHALDVATGVEKFGGPVAIQASVSGVGDGNDGKGNVRFNALKEHQRSGLALSNGVVYISWASHGDHDPYHGWVIGYNAQTLKQVMVFNDTPNGGRAGIWMAGMAPAIDAAGNLFLATGNGMYDANLPGGYEYGDSMLKLDPVAQKIADYFTPFNQASLNSADNDLASGGVIVLPDQPGDHPHLMVGAGKEGRIYLIDRDNMGGYNTKIDNVIQSIPGDLAYGSYGTPAFFNNNVYYLGSGSQLKAFTFGATTATTQNFNASSGFTGAGITLNGNAALRGSKIRLTDGGQSEAGSVWASSPVNIGQFSTEFQFQITNPDADGMAFVLQRNGPGALGAPGGDLGYGGIGNSICIKFDLYDNNGEGTNSTGLFVNGADPFVPATDLTDSGIDLHSGHIFDVTITYDGTEKVLSVAIKDDVDHTKVAAQSYNIDIAATIGGPAAFAGFTGGTGGKTATQDVLNWSYTSTIDNGPFTFYGLSSQPTSFATTTFGFPGATPSISADGDINGIVWVTQNTNPDPADHGSAYDCVLHAYSAADVSQELYNSSQASNNRDDVGRYVKFSIPTVANGKVYVGSTTNVGVYGLLAPSAATDVTSQVNVVKGGYRYSPAAKEYVQIDTITNTGSAPIAGPISLVLDNLTKTAVLAYAYPVTANAAPSGSPYINTLPNRTAQPLRGSERGRNSAISIPSNGMLQPGETISVGVYFKKPGVYTPRVLAGSGSR